MRLIIKIVLWSLFACGRESSPEGRSQIRDENIQKQIDTLRSQNEAILDSISRIRKDMK